jgi:hypothetical protein
MNENNIYNLPQLDKAANYPAAGMRGIWKNEQGGTLNLLGRGLPLPTPAFADPDEPVRAIPDPWAQPRVYGEALLDDKHSMIGRVEPEWRGLLALFALRDVNAANYALKSTNADISGNNIFAKVLRHMSPQVAIGGRAALWTTPVLLQIKPAGAVDYQTFAMGNPICILSPGRNSIKDLKIEGVPWAQGGVRDPLEHGGLSQPQLQMLRAWLVQLHADLNAFGADPVNDRIRDRIDRFSKACAEKIVGNGLKISVSASSRGDETDALFKPLWRAPKLEDDPLRKPETEIRLDPALKPTSLKGVLLVDAAIGHLPGRDAGSIFVYKNHTLVDLLKSDASFDAAKKEAEIEGYWLIRAGDMFTDRAVHLKSAGNDPAMVRGNPVGLQDMVLPIRPLALMLEGGASVVSGLSTEDQAFVSIKVTMAQGDQVEILRRYTPEPQAGEYLLVRRAEWDNAPVTVWPNFKSPAWNHYFARFVYPSKQRNDGACPTSFVSLAEIRRRLVASGDGSLLISELQSVNRGEALKAVKDFFDVARPSQSGAKIEELVHCTSPFDAVVYNEKSGGRDDSFVGLILLKVGQLEHEVTKSNVIAAVDFGTTSTVACLDDANPLLFKNRSMFAIINSKADQSQRWIESQQRDDVLDRFMPTWNAATPTTTVAATMDPTAGVDAPPLMRNFIYFHGDRGITINAESADVDKLKNKAGNYKFGIKWNEATDYQEASRDFLYQFMVMIAAEALDKGHDPRLIRWRFSIPDSLVGRQRDNFTKIVETLSKRISTDVRDDDQVNPCVGDLKSEGLAAASHVLLGLGNNVSSFNSVLDIGGGTTDVTMWDRDILVWKGSFRLAGLNFFTRYFTSNPGIFSEMKLDSRRKQFEALATPAKSPDKENRVNDYVAELLFSTESLQSEIDEYLLHGSETHHSKALKLTGLVMLGGFAWYLGIVARRLLAEGVVMEPSRFEHQAFALCGRGSGLFKKTHGFQPSAESDVSRVLRLFAVSARVARKSEPQIFGTPDAKLEVVRGMMENSPLINQSAKTGKDGAHDYLPAGLAVDFGSHGGLEIDDLISGDAMLTERVEKVEMAEFQAFIAALTSSADIKIDLKPNDQQGAQERIRDAVRQKLDSERKDREAGRALEPPFISALRALIELMAGPESVRKQQMSADFDS